MTIRIYADDDTEARMIAGGRAVELDETAPTAFGRLPFRLVDDPAELGTDISVDVDLDGIVATLTAAVVIAAGLLIAGATIGYRLVTR